MKSEKEIRKLLAKLIEIKESIKPPNADTTEWKVGIAMLRWVLGENFWDD